MLKNFLLKTTYWLKSFTRFLLLDPNWMHVNISIKSRNAFEIFVNKRQPSQTCSHHYYWNFFRPSFRIRIRISLFYFRGKSQMISTSKRHGKYEILFAYHMQMFPIEFIQWNRKSVAATFYLQLPFYHIISRTNISFGWALSVSFAWNNMYVLESDICNSTIWQNHKKDRGFILHCMLTGDITAHKYNRYLDGDFWQHFSHFYICKKFEIDKQKNENKKQKQSLDDKSAKCWLE